MIDNIRPIRPDPNVGTQGIDVGPKSRAYRVGYFAGQALAYLVATAVLGFLVWWLW